MIRYSKRQLNQDYDNSLNPILIATNITNKDVIIAKVLLDKNFIFKKFPICPPIKTATKRGQKFKNSSNTTSFVSCPATPNIELIKINSIPKIISLLIGSIIGFISGIIGIGGGIFLSPILFLMKAGYPKQIATTASLFILINSIFGVAGQLTKDVVFDEFLNFWPLFITVLIGGQIGNFLNIKFLSGKTLAIITSLLVMFVAIRMGLRLLP